MSDPMATVIELSHHIKIFLCYAHKDEELREEIDKQLKILKRRWPILEWYDGKIKAGTDWEKEIDTQLRAAQIILLLVSRDFMASHYCYGIEMKQALERHEQGAARVIPIILRPVDWEDTPFGKLQVLPTGGKPVTLWQYPDEAFKDISKSIEKNIKELLASYKIKEGDNLYKDNQHEKALIAYERAISFDPDSAITFNNKGNALFALSRYREALSAYDKALSLDPDLESAHDGQERAIWQLDNFGENQQRLETELHDTQQQLQDQQHLAQRLETELRDTQQQLQDQQHLAQHFETELHDTQQQLQDQQHLAQHLETELRDTQQQLQDQQHLAQQFKNKLREISDSLQRLIAESSPQDASQPDPEIGLALSSSLKQPSSTLHKQEEDENILRSGGRIKLSSLTKGYMVFLQARKANTPVSNIEKESLISKKGKKSSIGQIALLAGLILLLIGTISLLYYSTEVAYDANVKATAIALARANAATATSEAHVIAATAYATATTNGIMFGFNSQHTHWNSFERILDPVDIDRLSIYWTASTGNAISSSPAVANGVVYVSSNDSRLYAFNASGCGSGNACSPLWTASTGGSISKSITSSPAVANGVVYVSLNDGRLYAFNASGCGSGNACSPLWTASTGGSITSSPAVANGVVYVGGTDTLYAFNASGCGSGNTCSPLWTANVNYPVSSSSPAVANGVVYVSLDNGGLYAFNASGCGSRNTCSPLWTASTGGSITSSPAVANGVVYVSSNDSRLYAFNASGCGSGNTCSPLWTASTGVPISTSITSSPAVANGVVYVSSNDGRLYTFNASGCGSGNTCSPLWSSPVIGKSITSSPAVADGVVYIGSDDHRLYAFHLSGT